MLEIIENVDEKVGRNRIECRDRIDVLRSRVGLLEGKDKLLMTLYLENGNTFRQMARLAGVNEASISKKVYKIIKRLMDGQYITCLRNRDKLSEVELAVAKDYFLLGLALRKIGQKRKRTYYGVRKVMMKIQAVIKTE